MIHTHQTAPTQFVDANGIRFAYRRFGKPGGVPLVCNQHYTGTMDYWDPAVTDGLARDREVILFNNAGVSSSSGEVPATFEQMGANAIAFSLALGLTEVDVLGFSIGGMVAQEIALQAPNLVRKLILVGTGPRGGEGMASLTQVAQRIFGAAYDPPEHLWLTVLFSPSKAGQAAGLEFLKRKHLRQVGIEANATSNREETIMPNLSGKTALVTGASRGMGRASALALAAAGAQVLVHYGRGANEADGVVAEIRKAGGRADAIATDLAAADGASKLAKQARSIIGDRLDILVANAGISKAATIEETTVEDFDKLFAVDVRAPFFLVQQLLPIMSEGSSIVFLSSLAARAVVGTIPAYAATKGAIDTLVKHFASMLGALGIRVNAVAPGVVQTDMSNFTKTDAGRDFALGMQALKRLAQPDDIGGVVAFLASENARWITGDTIHVDGGSKL